MRGLGQERTAEPSEVEPEREMTPSVPLDFRSQIFRDTLKMIHDFPWTGTGLGTFPHIFPQYRERSLVEANIVHPESDWLMLAAEAGLPALVLIAGGVVLFCRILLRGQTHPYWPLRWGIVCAAVAALLHGLVDVPAHRVALGWWILILAGLGLQTPGPASVRSRMQWLIFALIGTLSLTTGIKLVRAEWFGAAALPPFAASRAGQEISRLYKQHDFKGAVEVAEKAIEVSPMEGSLYYGLGVSLLHFEGTNSAVTRAFAAQRLLNPSSPAIPFRQGVAWMLYDPERSLTLWREAIERRERLDQATAQEGATGQFQEILRLAQPLPEVVRALLPLAERHPSWLLQWLTAAPPALASTVIDRWNAKPETFEALPEMERRQLLGLWYQVGDREALFRFLDRRPDWKQTSRAVRLRQIVEAQEWEEAIRFASDEYDVGLDLPDPSTSELVARARPTTDPLVEFQAAWGTGNLVAARRLLDEAAAAKDPTPEVWRLRAALNVRDRQWQSAWDDVRRYIQARRLDEL